MVLFNIPFEGLREKDIRKGTWAVGRTPDSGAGRESRAFLSRTAKVARGRLRWAPASSPEAPSAEEPNASSLGKMPCARGGFVLLLGFLFLRVEAWLPVS